MDTSLIISIVSGSIAVISVIINFITTRKLEKLKYKFQEQLSEKNARTDYEYEARKKLYAEYEPIFFNLSELSESALSRIESLARSTRDGKLEMEDGWLSIDGYYLRSTIYKLFTPLASYRLMREKINLVDLRLDGDISMQYILAKTINRLYSSDFDFAREAPQLDYNATGSTMNSNLGVENPKKYWRQGIAAGHLDQFVETLIKDENGKKKIIDFGEFNDNLDIENSIYQKRYKIINYLFLNFKPDTRPVLWRMLITQAAICFIISKARFTNIGFTLNDIDEYLKEFELKFVDKFSFVQKNSKSNDLYEDEKTVFSIAKRYISENLRKYFDA